MALLEARFGEEAAALVRKLGGVPVSAPALREVPQKVPDLCTCFIERLAAARHPVVVCVTGAGIRALFDQAAECGCERALHAAVARATTVCRGPKPAGVLAARGLPVSIKAPPPFTTADVIEALRPLDLDRRMVAIVHYGERNETLGRWVRERGAELHELLTYQWQLPADTSPLLRLADDLLAGRIDAVAFTSQVQVRHLFEVAGPSKAPAMARALSDRVVTGAVGPTCAAALRAASVTPALVADPPKLAPLLAGLADVLEGRSIP